MRIVIIAAGKRTHDHPYYTVFSGGSRSQETLITSRAIGIKSLYKALVEGAVKEYDLAFELAFAQAV